MIPGANTQECTPLTLVQGLLKGAFKDRDIFWGSRHNMEIMQILSLV